MFHHVVQLLQLIWRSGTRTWNLRVPDLQLNCTLFIATHLMIGHTLMNPAGARSSDDLQWLESRIGYQVNSPRSDLNGDIPYWHHCTCIHYSFKSTTLCRKICDNPWWLSICIRSIITYDALWFVSGHHLWHAVICCHLYRIIIVYLCTSMTTWIKLYMLSNK